MTDDEGTSENLVSSHYSDVAASTRDIITEKKETEKKRQQQTSEMEALQKSVEALEANAKQINLTSQLSIITPLDELQLCLSQIKQSDSASEVLGESDFSAGHTEEKDLHREVWIEELEDMKEEFVESIDTAEELNFDEDVCFISSDVKCPLNRDGHSLSCMKANNIFSVQASQAYRFLEINISCPSKDRTATTTAGGKNRDGIREVLRWAAKRASGTTWMRLCEFQDEIKFCNPTI
ncbi:hypothetical protein E1301_Tti022941 [Triplophysa tibetana]|uniref:Uncharacterized protein n=1 Tax=Triplophysa tibetana TaxID=1572043 RepID=A0A5A9MT95_9TELE|nr:hypothetical protein E1301_Tti022941 [Triplophysa tibetana]